MMLLSQPLSLTHQRQLSTRHYTSAPKERFHFIPHCFLYCSEPTKPKTPKVLKFADQTSPLLTSSNVPQQAPPSLFLALDEEADDGGSGQTVRNLTEDLLVMEKVCSAAVVSRLTLHLILLLYYYIYMFISRLGRWRSSLRRRLRAPSSTAGRRLLQSTFRPSLMTNSVNIAGVMCGG